jgi:hypothetical protein
LKENQAQALADPADADNDCISILSTGYNHKHLHSVTFINRIHSFHWQKLLKYYIFKTYSFRRIHFEITKIPLKMSEVSYSGSYLNMNELRSDWGMEFCRSLFVLLSYGHCVVCSSTIYGFWLPLWYLQILFNRVVTSDQRWWREHVLLYAVG